MTVFYAQPYNLSATGFYFKDRQEYASKAASCVDDFGMVVEEFEIQLIDGEEIDAHLFNALNIHQGNIHHFLEKIEEWATYEKETLIIAVGECGYPFEIAKDDPNDFDIDLYEMDSLKDLAISFVEEGLYGDIPENLQYYIDYEAIARDLAVEYSEIDIDGQRYIYLCG